MEYNLSQSIFLLHRNSCISVGLILIYSHTAELPLQSQTETHRSYSAHFDECSIIAFIYIAISCLICLITQKKNR